MIICQFLPEHYEIDNIDNKDYKKRRYLVIFVSIFILVLLIIFVSNVRKIEPIEKIPTTLANYCGNRVCEAGENCYDCSADCPCPDDKYCDANKKECVLKLNCGDNICSPYENPENCCIDCGCRIKGEICNIETKICEIPKSNISDEFAIRKVREYLLELNITDEVKIRAGEDTIYNGKKGKNVYVRIGDEDDYRSTIFFVVTEDGEVFIRGMPI